MSGIGAFEGWQPAAVAAGAPASWWARAFATIIDGLILLACLLLCLFFISTGTDMDGEILAGLIYVAVQLFYAPLLLAINAGQTVGKQMAGVRVVRAGGEPIGFGRAFLREAVIKALLLSVPVLGVINFLWPLRQDEHKALHDLIAGTRVAEG